MNALPPLPYEVRASKAPRGTAAARALAQLRAATAACATLLQFREAAALEVAMLLRSGYSQAVLRSAWGSLVAERTKLAHSGLAPEVTFTELCVSSTRLRPSTAGRLRKVSARHRLVDHAPPERGLNLLASDLWRWFDQTLARDLMHHEASERARVDQLERAERGDLLRLRGAMLRGRVGSGHGGSISDCSSPEAAIEAATAGITDPEQRDAAVRAINWYLNRGGSVAAAVIAASDWGQLSAGSPQAAGAPRAICAPPAAQRQKPTVQFAPQA